MKYCKNCGAERKEHQAFCKSCGQPFQQAMAQASPSSTTNRGEKGNPPKQPMSPLKKVLVGIIILFAGFIIGGHFYLDNLYSPQKMVESVEKTILEKDVKGAKNIIDFSNVSKEVSDQEVSSYLAYLSENQKDWITNLRQVATDAENKGFFSALVEDRNQNQLFQVIKSGKKLGIYPQYKIAAIPFKLEVSANLADVEIDYLGKKETMKKEIHTLSVLPGNNDLKGSYNGEYVKLAETTELDFEDAEENTLNVNLEFEYEYVDVYSNMENSILYINGKNTGKEIGDGIEIGPLPTDEATVIYAAYKSEDGEVKSNEFNVETSGEVELIFDELEEGTKSTQAHSGDFVHRKIH